MHHKTSTYHILELYGQCCTIRCRMILHKSYTHILAHRMQLQPHDKPSFHDAYNTCLGNHSRNPWLWYNNQCNNHFLNHCNNHFLKHYHHHSNNLNHHYNHHSNNLHHHYNNHFLKHRNNLHHSLKVKIKIKLLKITEKLN